MKIVLIACGKLKESYLREAEAEYQKRLSPYCKLDIREVKDDAALRAAVPAGAHLHALDERGELVTSHDIAALIDHEEQRGGGAPVVFAIGGADGHGDELRKRATRLIAFGRVTIAHRLVRILLLEQLYRGFRIVRGEPYHRD